MPGMPGMPGASSLPAPTLARMIAFAPSPFFSTAGLIALALYALAVVRLVRRGDRWPVTRCLCFLLGVLIYFGATSTGLAEYGMYLFSSHMLQHMTLSMIAPIFLLLGAPITLALRALRPARRGRTGPRELLMALLHSRFALVVSSPLFTLPLFIVSLYGLYFTSLFSTLMSSEIGHDAMLVHFLVVGLLFFWPILGVDPAPHRSPYVIRIIELFAAMPFHAFFGIAVMMSNGLITQVFAHPPASWHISPTSDQYTAGSLAWAFGELPTIIVLLVLCVQWAKSDRREARRRDRKADRDGDQELNEYNAYLAHLASLGAAEAWREGDEPASEARAGAGAGAVAGTAADAASAVAEVGAGADVEREAPHVAHPA
jgi:cytochrome c oxidase assembly factor CtaG